MAAKAAIRRGSAGGSICAFNPVVQTQISAAEAADFCRFPMWKYGRGERIRTSGPCLPKTVLYQAELLPDGVRSTMLSGADRLELGGAPIRVGWPSRQALRCNKKTLPAFFPIRPDGTARPAPLGAISLRPVSPIEAVATLLGIANVTLVVRRSLWNYPFALAMVSLYAWIFLRERLYSDALLQGFYFVVNGYGWWNWRQAKASSGEVPVTRLGARARLIWGIGMALAALAWGALMYRVTDAAYPWWDGTIAVISITAQLLQSRRAWECWPLWIAVDLLAIPLFAVKGLWLTAGLYCLFLALSVWGAIDWNRARA